MSHSLMSWLQVCPKKNGVHVQMKVESTEEHWPLAHGLEAHGSAVAQSLPEVTGKLYPVLSVSDELVTTELSPLTCPSRWAAAPILQ